MALKDLGEKGIVDPYPPLVDIKGKIDHNLDFVNQIVFTFLTINNFPKESH